MSTQVVHMGFPPGQSQEEHRAGGGPWGWAVWVWPPLGLVARVSQPPTESRKVRVLVPARSMGQGERPVFCAQCLEIGLVLNLCWKCWEPTGALLCWFWVCVLPSYLSVH